MIKPVLVTVAILVATPTASAAGPGAFGMWRAKAKAARLRISVETKKLCGLNREAMTTISVLMHAGHPVPKPLLVSYKNARFKQAHQYRASISALTEALKKGQAKRVWLKKKFKSASPLVKPIVRLRLWQNGIEIAANSITLDTADNQYRIVIPKELARVERILGGQP